MTNTTIVGGLAANAPWSTNEELKCSRCQPNGVPTAGPNLMHQPHLNRVAGVYDVVGALQSLLCQALHFHGAALLIDLGQEQVRLAHLQANTASCQAISWPQLLTARGILHPTTPNA